MEIYDYDPITKVYSGFHRKARRDPVDGHYLIPAHATTVTPPEIMEGYAARLVTNESGGEEWALVPIKKYTVYGWDLDTGELIDHYEIETAASMEAIRIPPHHTIQKPPARERYKCQVWRDNRWQLVPDYRGTWINKQTLERMEITKIEQLPGDDWTDKPIPAGILNPVWDEDSGGWVEDPAIEEKKQSAQRETEAARQAIKGTPLEDADLQKALEWIDSVRDIDDIKRASKAFLAGFWALMADQIKGLTKMDGSTDKRRGNE